MGMTMTQKILARAAGLDAVVAGQLIEAKLDLVLGNDITTPVAITEFEKAGFTRVFDKDKIAIVLDHYTPCKDIKSAQLCKQAREFIPGIRTVITKYGKNRNIAEFLPEEEVLAKLYEQTALAMKADIAPKKLALPAKFEKRLTRSESAEACLERYLAKGIEARYGEDSHTVSVTLEDINDTLI